MNVQELITRFWSYNQKHNFGAVSCAIYLFLLEKWKDEKQVDSIRISDLHICQILSLTRPTVKTARDKLLKYGLVEFQSKNGSATYYKIVTDFSEIDFNPDISISSVKEKKPIRPELQDLNPAKNLKAIKPKAKVETEPEVKTENQKELPDGVPSFDEFLEYAKTLSIYSSNDDFAIQEKYNQLLDDKWLNNMQKPIRNWKALLKSTFPYLKKASENNTSIEIKKLPSIKRTQPSK